MSAAVGAQIPLWATCCESKRESDVNHIEGWVIRGEGNREFRGFVDAQESERKRLSGCHGLKSWHCDEAEFIVFSPPHVRVNPG